MFTKLGSGVTVKFYFGDLVLDSLSNCLITPTEQIQLRPQLVKVLVVLLRNAGGIVSSDDLLDQVWGHKAVSPSTVAQCVRELRSLMGDDAQDPRYIQTAHRVGYQFIADVRTDTDSQVLSSPAADHGIWAAITRPQARKPILLTALALILAATTYFLFSWYQRADESASIRDFQQQVIDATAASDASLQERVLGSFVIQHPNQLDPVLDLADLLLSQYRLLEARQILQPIAKKFPNAKYDARFLLLFSKLEGLASNFDQQKEWATSGLEKSVAKSDLLRLKLKTELLKSEIRLGTAGNIDEQIGKLLEVARKNRWRKVENALRQLKFAGVIRTGDDVAITSIFEDFSSYARETKQPKVLQSARIVLLGYLIDAHRYDEARTVLGDIGEVNDDHSTYEAGLIYQMKLLFHLGKREIAQALTAGQLAEKYFAKLGDSAWLAGVRLNVGIIQIRLGEDQAAKSSFRNALTTFTTVGDARGQAIVWSNLANLAKRKGDYTLSTDYSEQALALFEKLSDESGAARVSFNLGRAEILAGELENARIHIEKAADFYQSTGQAVLHAHVLSSIVQVDRLEGKLAHGIAQAKLAWEISSTQSAGLQSIMAQYHLGETLRLDKQFAAASAAFNLAIELATEAPRTDWARISQLGLAAVYADQGNYDLALEEARLISTTQLAEKDEAQDMLKTYLLLAQSYYAIGKVEQAQTNISQAAGYLKDVRDPGLQLRVGLMERRIQDKLTPAYREWLQAQLVKHPNWELSRQIETLDWQ